HLLKIIDGTAGSGVMPALPSDAIHLAQIKVPAASTAVVNANITDGRTFVFPGQGQIGPSTARPATPFTGMLWVDTDTVALKMWNGSTWAAVGGTNATLPKGRIAKSKRLTSQSLSSGNAVYTSVTFTAEANRIYRITAYGMHFANGTANSKSEFHLRKQSGSTITHGGSSAFTNAITAADVSTMAIGAAVPIFLAGSTTTGELTAGTWTIGITRVFSSGGTQHMLGGWLFVDDVGGT
ncbi:MAG: hypothetical protein L0Y56_15950, partial [Nitrospira sp.]|nr:hypothetical protein [Nitrospira sp.]